MTRANRDAPRVDADIYPADVQDVAEWLTWKSTDDGRKVPHAPYEHHNHPDRYVSAQEPAMWTAFHQV